MPRKAVLVALALLVLLSATSASVFLASRQPSPSETSTSESTVCSISGAPFGVVLRLLSDSGVPVAGARVSGQAVAYCGSERQANALPAAVTNSTGWASLLDGYPGNYYLTISYQGQTYNLTVPTNPTDATYATYSIPSGRLTTSFCFANQRCAGA